MAMSFRCDDSLVQLYVEGALEPAERLLVGAHIRICRACQQGAAAYKALLWDLEHPEPEAAELPAAQLQALSDRLMEAWEQGGTGQAPGRTPARAIWDFSSLWLRSVPVMLGSAPARRREQPVAKQQEPDGWMTRVGHGLGRLLVKGVRRR